VDEMALVKDAQGGDLDAFNRLVLFYQDQAFNLSFRMLGDDDSAEDATQNAFIAAYRNLNSYRGGSFRAGVLRIVTNTCYDELRRRKRRPVVPLEPESSDEEEIESPRWLADGSPTPEEAVERSEIGKAIQHCLEGLPDEFRMIAVLVDVQGIDYEEASTIIGKPLGTVKSRLARARSKLRDCLRSFRELLPLTYRSDHEAQS
jgi:RNA polymerase sigma factor (sigma-70 family)